MKIFYRDEMAFFSNDPGLVSLRKSKLFVDYLKSKNYTLDICEDFSPCMVEDYYLAHDKEYVDKVMSLQRRNGFGTYSSKINSAISYSCGSFLAASLHSINAKENTLSPSSGFHHAGYFKGGGFCTFNGLMVAALRLKNLGLVNTIGIIDCDNHPGDGTDDIIKRLNLDWIRHYSFGMQGVIKDNARTWLGLFRKELRMFRDVDIVFYQAGADPHIDDPYGGVLSSKQLYERDKFVFRAFNEFGIPLVWNLAGGYQKPIEKVLGIHIETYIALDKLLFI